MGKRTSKAAPAAAPAPAPGTITVVTPKKAFRQGTARQLHWLSICAYNGLTANVWVTHAIANPPLLVQGGKHKGQVEPPQGYVGFFVRHGYISVA